MPGRDFKVRPSYLGILMALATESNRFDINQTTHGFSVGDVVRLSGGSYVKAKADSAANAEVAGIVAAVADANNFTLAVGGRITGLSGLTAGQVRFLDPTTAGATTATEPSTVGQISKPLMLADSTTSAYFYNLRGSVISSPSALLAFDTRASDTILGVADAGKTIRATATFTQTLTAAATLGAGWWVLIENATANGTDILTIDANASETIDGRLTIPMYSGDTRILMCDGTNFTTVMLRGGFFYIESTDSAVSNYDMYFPSGAIWWEANVGGSGGGAGGGINSNGASASGGAGGGGGCTAVVTGSFVKLSTATFGRINIAARGQGGTPGNDGTNGGIAKIVAYNNDDPLTGTIVMDVEAGGGGKGAKGVVAAGSRSGGGGSRFGSASGGISATPNGTTAVGMLAASSGIVGGGNGAPSEKGGASGGGGANGAVGWSGGDSIDGGPGGGGGGGVSASAAFDGGFGGYGGEWGVGDSGSQGVGGTPNGTNGASLNELSTYAADAGAGGGGANGGVAGNGGNCLLVGGGGGGGSTNTSTLANAGTGGKGGKGYLRFTYG